VSGSDRGESNPRVAVLAVVLTDGPPLPLAQKRGPTPPPRGPAAATLTGNLTREVELRPLPSGTEVARLCVARGRAGGAERSGSSARTTHRRGPWPAGKSVRGAPRLGLVHRRRRRARLAGMDRRGGEPARDCRAQSAPDPVRAHRFERVGRGEPGERNGSPDASPVPVHYRLRRPARTIVPF
jgi:hypothetical protein